MAITHREELILEAAYTQTVERLSTALTEANKYHLENMPAPAEILDRIRVLSTMRETLLRALANA